MRLWIALCAVLWAGSSHAQPPMDAPTGWKPTFVENFDTLDLSRWSTTYWWGGRWNTKGELQIYTDPAFRGTWQHPLRLSPFSINQGILTIRAQRVSPEIAAYLGGRTYTSGMLTTARSFMQTYGYFEMRAQFPLGRGLWPAFWLATTASWPPEIDIVEMLGDQPTTMHTAIHIGLKEEPIDRGTPVAVADMTSGFHRYGLLWTPSHIAWYFDGRRVTYIDTPLDLHQPLLILLNLAVGGEWPGVPNDQTKFPADMQVDYVKAFALQ